MFQEKEKFLKEKYVPLLQTLNPDEKSRWGKMDVQQMVEHMRDVFKVANGKMVFPLITTDTEKLEKMRAFIVTDAPFRENTRMPLMPEEPRPHKYSSLDEAITKMNEELQAMFAAYAAAPSVTFINPVFGWLNYEEQIHLLYKHALHHLRQFGATPNL